MIENIKFVPSIFHKIWVLEKMSLNVYYKKLCQDTNWVSFGMVKNEFSIQDSKVVGL